MNGGQSQTGFKPGDLGIADAPGSDDPAQAFLAHFERGIAGKHSADRRQCGRVEAPVRFFVELAVSQKRGAARQTSRALGISNQLAQPQQNVLIAGQARHARFFHDLGQGVQSQRRDISAHVRVAGMQCFEFLAPARGSAGRAS